MRLRVDPPGIDRSRKRPTVGRAPSECKPPRRRRARSRSNLACNLHPTGTGTRTCCIACCSDARCTARRSGKPTLEAPVPTWSEPHSEPAPVARFADSCRVDNSTEAPIEGQVSTEPSPSAAGRPAARSRAGRTARRWRQVALAAELRPYFRTQRPTQSPEPNPRAPQKPFAYILRLAARYRVRRTLPLSVDSRRVNRQIFGEKKP